MRVRTKQSLLLLIALTVALSLLGGNAWATKAKESAAPVVDKQVRQEETSPETMEETGSCGEQLTWTLNGGTLIISGTGGMSDYRSGQSPWYGSREEITDVVIEEGVTNIGAYAFASCTNMNSVIISTNSMTQIGAYAFYNCNGLNNITIPDGVTKIGAYAFNNCTELVSVTLPDSVASIDEYAFSYCSRLTDFKIPSTVTDISYGMFYSCNRLENIVIPHSVTCIGYYAFSGCSKLTNIIIPDSVTDIKSSAFEGCSSLASLNIPNSVTDIGISAFSGCNNLMGITISNRVTRIESGLFDGCRSLTDIIIPDGVMSTGSSSFRGCRSLTNITIPSSLTKIGTRSFEDCTSLKSIVLPKSVTSIGSFAFDGCSRLSNIYYAGDEESWNEISVDAYNQQLLTARIHYNANGPSRSIDFSTCTVTLDNICTYNGRRLEPAVTVKDGDKVLCKGADYSVSYANNIDAGVATVTVTGEDDYNGSITKMFIIQKANQTVSAKISASEIRIGETMQITARAVNPVSYRSSSEKIATVSNSGIVTGKSGGTATITVIADESRNYKKASRTIRVTVLKEKNTITASNVTKVASSKPQAFSLNAKAKGGAKLAYKSNQKSIKVDKNGKVTVAQKFVGQATITITAAATGTYYEATKQVTVTVNPTGTSLTSVKNSAKKTMKAAWKKNTAVTGYQVQYATASNFKGAKTVTIKKTKTTSTTIKKLKKNKKYFVRVRTYQKASGKNYYSNWSKTKTVTIKK